MLPWLHWAGSGGGEAVVCDGGAFFWLLWTICLVSNKLHESTGAYTMCQVLPYLVEFGNGRAQPPPCALKVQEMLDSPSDLRQWGLKPTGGSSGGQLGAAAVDRAARRSLATQVLVLKPCWLQISRPLPAAHRGGGFCQCSSGSRHTEQPLWEVLPGGFHVLCGTFPLLWAINVQEASVYTRAI